MSIFRLLFIVILVGNVAISAYFRRKARAGEAIPRSRERGGLVALRLAVALPILAGLLAYAVAPSVMAWAALPLPAWVRAAAAVLGLAVAPLLVWIFRAIGPNISETVLTKTTHALVTHGPYRWVRHPLYAAGLLLLTSLGLVAASGFLLVASALGVGALLAVVIPREEAHLVAAFGEDYRRYQATTGRLLPRLGGRRAAAP